MNNVEREIEAFRAHGYLERAGGNQYDAKTQEAYKRFKAVPWYLRDKQEKRKGE